MLAALLFLADDDDPFSIFFACICLLILVAGGAYAVIWLRRRYWGPDDEGGVPQVGFTLGDLRQLHKSGRLSAEEFERAKEKIVAAAKRASERDAPKTHPDVQRPPPD